MHQKARDKLSELPFDTKITYQPSFYLDSHGRRQINDLLYYLYRQYLPSDFWDRQSKAKPARRVSKHMKDTHGIVMAPSVLNDLGTRIESYAPSNPYIFDFTRDLFWKAGDFGDSSSCFFGYNRYLRFTIEKAGGFAVRFYRDSGKGYSRAWCLPIAQDQLAVFNGQSGLSTDRIVQILSSWMGIPWDAPDTVVIQNSDGKRHPSFYTNGTVHRIGSSAGKDIVLKMPIYTKEQVKDCKCGRMTLGDLCDRCIEEEGTVENRDTDSV